MIHICSHKKPINPIRIIIFLLALGFTSALLAAPVPPPAPLTGIDQLQNFLGNLKTLRANFQQVVYANDRMEGETAAGKIYLQRPDLFRWDYTRPGQQQIIADGLSVWYYEPDLEQTSVLLQSVALQGTPVQALLNQKPVETFFKLEEKGIREGLAWVLLTSKEEEPRFSEIEMGFADNLLQALRMVDSFGQTTWLLFQQMEINIPLDAELFQFEPPEDSDYFEY